MYASPHLIIFSCAIFRALRISAIKQKMLHFFPEKNSFYYQSVKFRNNKESGSRMLTSSFL